MSNIQLEDMERKVGQKALYVRSAIKCGYCACDSGSDSDYYMEYEHDTGYDDPGPAGYNPDPIP